MFARLALHLYAVKNAFLEQCADLLEHDRRTVLGRVI